MKIYYPTISFKREKDYYYIPLNFVYLQSFPIVKWDFDKKINKIDTPTFKSTQYSFNIKRTKIYQSNFFVNSSKKIFKTYNKQEKNKMYRKTYVSPGEYLYKYKKTNNNNDITGGSASILSQLYKKQHELNKELKTLYKKGKISKTQLTSLTLKVSGGYGIHRSSDPVSLADQYSRVLERKVANLEDTVISLKNKPKPPGALTKFFNGFCKKEKKPSAPAPKSSSQSSCILVKFFNGIFKGEKQPSAPAYEPPPPVQQPVEVEEQIGDSASSPVIAPATENGLTVNFNFNCKLM